MNKQCLVQVTDIKKAYQLGNTSLMALRGVSVAVRKGEVIGLYGRSGSGKTTFLNAMGLVETIDEGEIAFQGRNVCGLSDASLAEIRNRSMGFIFQNFNLIPVLNAFENVEYPLLLARVGKRERNARVVEVLAAVGLEKHMAHRPDELSGGQRQRVAIARALVNKPEVVFADEATSALDKKTSIEVMELCKQINAQTGTTFVFSSHDDIVASYCHRVIEISDGELVDKVST